MPNFTVAQLYCPACGHELDGQVDAELIGYAPRWELCCVGCGWRRYGREAKYEFEAAGVELGVDVPIGGLVIDA